MGKLKGRSDAEREACFEEFVARAPGGVSFFVAPDVMEILRRRAGLQTVLIARYGVPVELLDYLPAGTIMAAALIGRCSRLWF